jgi:hypothetical protein
MRHSVAFLLVWLNVWTVSAQVQDTSVFRFPVQMDSVVVRAARGGWDVQAFIGRVQTDTSFYKAFRTLRLVAYDASNDVRILDRKGAVKASLVSRTRQTRRGSCRSLQTLSEQVSGDYYTRTGKHNYYTAELYAYLFLQKGPICNESDVVAGALEEKSSGSLAKSKYQLKQLIFNPGSKVHGVPFMGDKASIFDKDIAKMYDFKLESTAYLGEDCYLFRALPKPEYKDELVYNELSTWFRKSDWSILARDYSLSFSTAVYDFDVRMKVRLGYIGGRLVPQRIEYDGNWHVIMKGRERGKFVLQVSPQ